MADESESIGGISIGVGIDDSKVDAELAALLGRLRAEAERAQIGIPVGIQQSTAAGAAQRQQAQQAPRVVVGAGAATAAQAQQGQSAFQRAINAELAKTGDRYNEVTGEIEKMGRAAKSTRASVSENLAQATSIPFDSPEIEPTVKTEKAQAEVNEFFAKLKAVFAEASEQAVITPRVAKPNLRAAAVDPRQLQELSYLNQSEGQTGTSSTLAPQRTAQQRAAFIAAEQRRADEMRRTQASVVSRPAYTSSFTRGEETYRPPSERFSRGAGGSGAGGGLAARRLSDEEIARRQATSEAITGAGAFTSGRTLRTNVSGLGSFALGGGREKAQAEAELRASTQRRIRDERDLAEATRFSQRPEVIANIHNRRDALADVTTAQQKLTKSVQEEDAARAKVQSFASAGSAARNLLGIAAAGAAFGLAFKAVDIALELTGKALDPLVSRFLGFSNVAGRVTDTLSDQTKQAYGNVTAVVALAQAQAGLSASSAKIITPLITQQTQIEAGNKSLTEAVDLFQTYQRLSETGVKGLTQGTGGILGSGLFGTPSAAQELGRLFSGLPSVEERTPGSLTGAPKQLPGSGGLGPFGINPIQNVLPSELSQEDATRNTRALAEGLKYTNEQIRKGGGAAETFTNQLSDTEFQRSLQAFKDIRAPVELLNELQRTGVGIRDADTGSATRALQFLSIGSGRPDPEVLAAQFAQQRQAQIAAANRQQQFALNTQLPAQAALGRLAQPFQPTGTGIAAANADEADQIAASGRETLAIQGELNAYYEKGRQILATTYGVPLDLLNRVKSVSQDIADIQAGISNEQAAYQTAQFNYQLQIAKRSLADIGGLTGRNFGEGQSYLGVLERQNLALSRQGQLLSFELNQRQINFQTAVAGFEAPGITPAERQARIKQAQIEASFAQKQLDIQRQMFGNTVEIVDISNLRQGVDLANQIGLLLQGRQVTIDTALAQEQLTRLDAEQKMLVDNVGTYISEVNSLTAIAFGEIQQLEAAAGEAIGEVATDILRAFGIVIGGLNDYLEGIGSGGGGGNRNQGSIPLAGGALFNTSGPRDITVGEAANETVAVLRNPRAYLGATASSGGNTVIIDVHDNPVRSESDLDNLTRKIVQAMGRQASTIGLRPGG